MLPALEKAKANGTKIAAVNPLPEAGLMRFKDPQKIHAVVGDAVPIADKFLQIRIEGDQALFQGMAKLLFDEEDRNPGSVLVREFRDTSSAGFEPWAERIRTVDLETVIEATGLTTTQLEQTTAAMIASRATIICWAMGLTQQTHAVATIQDAVALLLMIGKSGAGVCPVRGHSNVQGDHTMGIWEKMPEEFLQPWTRSSVSAVLAGTASTRSTPSVPCARAPSAYSWQWAATFSPPPPTPTSPQEPYATAP